MCSILGIPSNDLKYILELTDEEKENGRNHLLKLGVNFNKSIIGIHTGGGGRWKHKQWHEERFISLISEILHEFGQNYQILLLGGPLERDRNQRIKEKVVGSLFDAGWDNDVRHFASLVGCCSVVVSGDSLAMHIALAMKKRVVVLFGPTSHNEIDLFGLGEKIIPNLDCLVCYKNECDCSPNCMDLISINMVKNAILKQLTFKN
jgi:heptosyltransferase-2